MAKKLQVSALYTLLVISNLVLISIVFVLPFFQDTLFQVCSVWLIGQMLCYVGVGLGIALPIALIALAFAWIQMILIAAGTLEPHLVSKDFVQALVTILKNFSDWIASI